jgi:hypothetical protein
MCIVCVRIFFSVYPVYYAIYTPNCSGLRSRIVAPSEYERIKISSQVNLATEQERIESTRLCLESNFPGKRQQPFPFPFHPVFDTPLLLLPIVTSQFEDPCFHTPYLFSIHNYAQACSRRHLLQYSGSRISRISRNLNRRGDLNHCSPSELRTDVIVIQVYLQVLASLSI